MAVIGVTQWKVRTGKTPEFLENCAKAKVIPERPGALSVKGIHHLGLATHNMEATLAFYQDVLGFDAKVCDLRHPEGGGTVRHAFLDMGNDMGGLNQYISGIPTNFNLNSAALRRS